MRTVVLLVLSLLLFGATAAIAQPAERAPAAAGSGGPTRTQVVQPRVVQPSQRPAKVERAEVSRMTPHSDRYEAKPSPKQPGLALLFWVFAAVSVGGALFVVTRRNLISAVMGMVGSFVGIAAVYMMLYAHFLSVVQMLVYAGAIMVLFVFVIMILNRPEDEPVAPTGRAGQAIAGLAIVYLVGRLIMMLIQVKPPTPSALNAPAPVSLPPIGEVPGEKVDWGSVKSVGMNLFTEGLFPFEAISILLLVAVVGAIAIARPMHDQEGDVA